MSAFFQGHEIHRGRPCQVINGRNWRMDIARQSATHKWMFHFILSKRTNKSTREALLYLSINNEFLARETTGGLPGIMRAPGPRSPWDGEAPTHHHPSEGAQCRGFYPWTEREGFFKASMCQPCIFVGRIYAPTTVGTVTSRTRLWIS